MDKKLGSETLALVLMFAAFPITSLGTTSGSTVAYSVGVVCLILGGLLPVLTRYMDHSGDTIRDVGLEFDDRTS